RITGAQDYNILSQWWNDRGKQYGRPIFTGHAWYKMVDANDWAASEIENQIILNRLPVRNEIKGEIGYRTLQIMNNSKGLRTALQQGLYRYPAYVPPYPWKDAICPEPPTLVRLEGDTLRWERSLPAADGDTAVKYVVYGYDNNGQASLLPQDGTKVISITPRTKLYIANAGYMRYAVSALDKNNNESVAAVSSISEVLLCAGGSTSLPAMVTGNSYQWQILNGETWEALQPNAHFTGTQTSTLHLTDLPVDLYGIQLRCVADGVEVGGEYMIRFGSLWTATANEKWQVGANWSCGTVPTLHTDAIIHGGVTPFPVVESPGAEARRLLLRTGAQVNILPGMQLTVGQQ
ncbi:MAG TPA: hypothetical protein VK907_08030, partial [Phnomibacter sp.]|nr:hypothetical protein [Phnomibacter sp.]